jgi:hypothetical protein
MSPRSTIRVQTLIFAGSLLTGAAFLATGGVGHASFNLPAGIAAVATATPAPPNCPTSSPNDGNGNSDSSYGNNGNENTGDCNDGNELAGNNGHGNEDPGPEDSPTPSAAP